VHPVGRAQVCEPAVTQMRSGLFLVSLVSSTAVASSQMMAQAAPTLIRQQSRARSG